VATKFTYSDIDNSDTWKEYSQLYNAAGQVTQQNGLYDSGDTWEYIFTNGVLNKYTYVDVDNSDSWREYSVIYNDVGQAVKQTGIYDNGTTWEYLY
jgi:polyphosphate kinase 2 (PPK2 family)